MVIGRSQLDAVRTRVRAGREPWHSAYEKMRTSRYGSLAYTPHPAETVPCPPNAGPPSCLAEREDAIAAYTQALLWSVDGDEAHARKAVEIMDGWSKVMKEHTEGNAGLQTAWAGSSWARAADIVHAGYPKWGAADVQRFKWMLRKAYLPAVTAKVPDYNGNWELAMTDAAIGIAVFLEDRELFTESLGRYRARVPAYFYLGSDGKLPVPPPGGTMNTPEKLAAYWFGQRTYADGLGQETCRNFMHIGYSLAASAHIAETAWQQGVDLYGPTAERLRAALEFHARYQLGEAAPPWLCGGKVERTMGPDVEVALNHLRNRMHLKLPETEKLAERQRPAGTDDLFVAWETLTHADNPGRGAAV
ncbi:alginate lyase family protein [Streptomyces sp. BPTC-684]|uniref:alginate lyase family protein n=1 Tax=Streptomyces sp. BPTC-684 TaxID=3043734 RepID=UPI0024B0F7CF|nr:alginate lyase family protein [Streptomyces sp. BPTC-684]WHM41173.1 alginate lyase family protein [Streptomyces sp. BPTC-684]